MDRKEQMLKAAYEIVGDDGLEGLHARTVAAKIGVNHALVHYYFPKREDLVLGVAGYLKSRFDADVAHFQQSAKTPGDQVASCLAQCEAYCKPASRLYRVWASLFVASRSMPAVKDALITFWEGWAAGYQAAVDAGVAAKQVTPNSPFANGDMLLASMLGIGLVAHLSGNSEAAVTRLDQIEASVLGGD